MLYDFLWFVQSIWLGVAQGPCMHMYKLQSYGVSGPILEWFISYLSNRSQKVMYKSVGYINAGVPQSSVLGPLLFLLYLNDIAENMRSVCKLYADDNSLQQCSDYIYVMEDNLNYDLL